MIDDHIRIVPVKTEDLYIRVMEACHKDDDDMYEPTHAVLKGDEIVGAFSLMVPMVNWWMKRDSSSRESWAVSRCMEALLMDKGIDGYIMPCNTDSPYFKNMERIGFEPVEDNIKFFSRKLKGEL